MTNSFNEDIVEQAAIEWLTELGYQYKHGSELPRLKVTSHICDVCSGRMKTTHGLRFKYKEKI